MRWMPTVVIHTRSRSKGYNGHRRVRTHGAGTDDEDSTNTTSSAWQNRGCTRRFCAGEPPRSCDCQAQITCAIQCACYEHLKVLEAARVFILPTASDGCDEPLLGLSDCGPWRFASSASVCMPLRSPTVWLHRAREVVFMPVRQRSSIWIANKAQEGFATGSRRSSHSAYRLRQWRHDQRRLRDVCITQSPLNQLSDIVTQLKQGVMHPLTGQASTEERGCMCHMHAIARNHFS